MVHERAQLARSLDFYKIVYTGHRQRPQALRQMELRRENAC